MGLSAWNAYRARQAELEKTMESSQEQKPEKENSTSPVADGVEVEEPKVMEEVKPKPKKKKTTTK